MFVSQFPQLDIEEDFLSLMSDDGSTKDDVKLPDANNDTFGVRAKIDKLYTQEGKDLSKRRIPFTI